MQENAKHVRLEEVRNVQEGEIEISSRKPREERSELERDEGDFEALRGEVLLEEAREHATRAIRRNQETECDALRAGGSGIDRGRSGSRRARPVTLAEELARRLGVVLEEVMNEGGSIDCVRERPTNRGIGEGACVDARHEVGEATPWGLADVYPACFERSKKPRGDAAERHVGTPAREPEDACVFITHRLHDDRVGWFGEHAVSAWEKREPIALARFEAVGT